MSRPIYTRKIPKSLGSAVDLLYQVREERYALQRDVAKFASFENELNLHILDELKKKGDQGVSGKTARVQKTKKIVPHVTDWGAFYKYISRTKSFDLLQRRVTESAIRERWGNKKNIPGVGQDEIVRLSIHKVT